MHIDGSQIFTNLEWFIFSEDTESDYSYDGVTESAEHGVTSHRRSHHSSKYSVQIISYIPPLTKVDVLFLFPSASLSSFWASSL